MAVKKKAAGKSSKGFSAEEKAAMKERAKELKRGAENGESDVVAAYAKMPGLDRTLGERVHAIVKADAPSLTSRLWYGMPAYAKDGKVVCFFQSATKFKARYATLGFMHAADLDDGAMWPVAFALTGLTAAVEKQIAELVKRAAS